MFGHVMMGLYSWLVKVCVMVEVVVGHCILPGKK